MNYYRQLYEATAWSDSQVRAVESVAILLALERNGEPMPAKSVIEWYRTTNVKLT